MKSDGDACASRSCCTPQGAAKITSRIFNLGTGTSTAVNELTCLVGKVFGTGAPSIVDQLARAVEIRQCRVQIVLAQLSLQWRFSTCLGAGLKQLAAIPTFKPCQKK